MQKALSNQIIDLYKTSDCPVIITDTDYSLLGANENATTVFGLQKIAEITRLSKNQIGNNLSGAFVFAGEQNAYVETVTNDSVSVRVIHVSKKLTNEDTNALFRSTAAEIQFHQIMTRLFQSLSKFEKHLGEDFTQIEKDVYSILELLNTTTERYKNENGLKARNECYFNIAQMMDSVLSQVDLITRVLGITVAFEKAENQNAIVKYDKDCVAQAVIKLVRALCRFASDDFVRVFQKYDETQVKYTFCVRSTEVLKWQEKNLSVDDLLSVVRNFNCLHDGILLTDALYEFKCEGILAECETTDNETRVTIAFPYEKKQTNKLNSTPLNYIGDPFSTLTVLFMGFEK